MFIRTTMIVCLLNEPRTYVYFLSNLRCLNKELGFFDDDIEGRWPSSIQVNSEPSKNRRLWQQTATLFFSPSTIVLLRYSVHGRWFPPKLCHHFKEYSAANGFENKSEAQLHQARSLRQPTVYLRYTQMTLVITPIGQVSLPENCFRIQPFDQNFCQANRIARLKGHPRFRRSGESFNWNLGSMDIGESFEQQFPMRVSPANIWPKLLWLCVCPVLFTDTEQW